MKKIYGFDIDGVIAKIPFGRKLGNFIWPIFVFLSKFRIVRVIYDNFFRRPNWEIIRVIQYLKGKGFPVYIVSGNPEYYRKELENWLKKYDIFYEKLYLWPGKTDMLSWKRDKICELGICYYIDDLAEVIEPITSKGVNALQYKNQKAEEIIFFLDNKPIS